MDYIYITHDIEASKNKMITWGWRKVRAFPGDLLMENDIDNTIMAIIDDFMLTRTRYFNNDNKFILGDGWSFVKNHGHFSNMAFPDVKLEADCLMYKRKDGADTAPSITPKKIDYFLITKDVVNQ